MKKIQTLEDCPSWVQEHSYLQPWATRKLVLRDALEQRRLDYSTSLFDRRPQEEHAETAGRMLHCWIHHWGTARDAKLMELGPMEVLQSICEGKGFVGRGELAGNPLFDVVHAVAYVEQQNKAVEFFVESYQRLAIQYAGKRDPNLANEAEQWWNDFLCWLGGTLQTDTSAAPLSKFDGRTTLRHWFPKRLWGFLRNWRRSAQNRWNKRAAMPEEEIEEQGDNGMNTAGRKEELQKFSDIVHAAFTQLQSEERCLIDFFYVQNLSNKQVAAILGKHEGTITRSHQKAISRFGQLVQEEYIKHNEQLEVSNERDFAFALIQLIKDQNSEESDG